MKYPALLTGPEAAGWGGESHFHRTIREPVPKNHAREAKERTCTLTSYFRGHLRGYKPRVVKST